MLPAQRDYVVFSSLTTQRVCFSFEVLDSRDDLMSFKKYLLVCHAIFVPLWLMEINYAMRHVNYQGYDVCALFVYLTVVPATAYFVAALRSRSCTMVMYAAAVSLTTPLVVNAIGWWVASNFGGMGCE